jgi:hypothetical protein
MEPVNFEVKQSKEGVTTIKYVLAKVAVRKEGALSLYLSLFSLSLSLSSLFLTHTRSRADLLCISRRNQPI